MLQFPDLVGRQRELDLLTQISASRKSEFVAMYGRRRVGKTFLIRTFFDRKFAFQISGLASADTKQQLMNFHAALQEQSSLVFESVPENWFEAFQRLKKHLNTQDDNTKKVVFFDELPWLDTPKSDFIVGLEHFWNSYASARKDILLIGCGSAASWMINTLISNTGGLHNRVTHRIKVEPFNLHETELMLRQKGSPLERYQIAQIYMVLGGIPFYLDAIKPELSAAQNIQSLLFNPSGLLAQEFGNLYRSLFKNHEVYELVVEALSTKTYGLTRADLISATKLPSGGTLTKVLAELEESGFIRRYPAFDKKQKNELYRLSDYFSCFYLRFMKHGTYKGPDAWMKAIDQPSFYAWQGITFEQICIDHTFQIKKALGVGGVITTETAWRGTSELGSAQVDLLIERRDQIINLCEAKFSNGIFSIDKDYFEQLRNKVWVFKSATKTRKTVLLTMISTYGVVKNQYALGYVHSEVLLDDLFIGR
jgi:uncharacterized protein